MGLRSRKKEQRERRIMDAALALFTKQGFADTNMEQIAECADVGVGTVYNYFKNKNALLVAIFDEVHRDAVSNIEIITADPPENPVDGILDVLFSYDTWNKYSKPLLRELFAVIFMEMNDMGRDFMQMDMEVIGQLGVLLDCYRNRGAIDADVNLQEATMLIYSGFCMQMFMYIAMDDMTMDMLKGLSRRQFELMFRGFHPREESGSAAKEDKG